MKTHCITCNLSDGPTSMGFVAGPIVNGEKTAIPATSCTLCKQPVTVYEDDTPPAGGYGLHEPPTAPAPRPRAAVRLETEPVPDAGPTFNVIKASRERLRDLKRLLKRAAGWQREHDELERLLKAAQSKPAPKVVGLRDRVVQR